MPGQSPAISDNKTRQKFRWSVWVTVVGIPQMRTPLLAVYIKNELEGKPNDFQAMVEQIKRATAHAFCTGKTGMAPAADFDLCLSLNRFNFVLKVDRENDLNYLKRLNWNSSFIV